MIKEVTKRLKKLIFNDRNKVRNEFIIDSLIYNYYPYGIIEVYYIYNPFIQKYLWEDGTIDYKTSLIDFDKSNLIIDYPAYYVTYEEAKNMLDKYKNK